MKFGITNLSWKEEFDSNPPSDFDYIETVFNRRKNGKYYSTQSIFYGSNVESFADYTSTKNRLDHIIDECVTCGIKVIVFGSPSLRKGTKDVLHRVFDSVDSKLKEHDIYLCIEPNSKYYGGDYYHRVSEIVTDIKTYSHIKTMIDTHNLILEGDDIITVYNDYQKYIKHIHFSEKDLLPIKNYDILTEFTSHLYESGYQYGITYELKPNDNYIELANEFLKLKT